MAAFDVVSTSTRGIGVIDEPVISAAQLIGHPGAHPTITVPMVDAVPPPVDELWDHLAEAAEFYGIEIPACAVLRDCLTSFTAALRPAPKLTALTVTLIADAAEFVVTGAEVPALGPAVRIGRFDRGDGVTEFPLPRPDDADWRRMAARTTSGAERDRLRDWLTGSGCADGLCPDTAAPFLGALVYTRGDDAYGVENPEPTSILAQLQGCRAIAGVHIVDVAPAGADHVWWISPEYRVHPVRSIGADTYPEAVVPMGGPSFARLP